MRRLSFILTVCCLLLATTGRSQIFSKGVKASKHYVTKEMWVSSFSKLSVAGSADVFFTQKEGKPKVEICTSDNIIELLDIYVKNQTLHIGFKKGTNVRELKRLDIKVSSPELEAVSVAGSGDIELVNGLRSEYLAMSVAGSGDIIGKEIQCNDLSASVAGSGDLSIARLKCRAMKVSIAGSGILEIANAVAQEAKASIAGSGELTLRGSCEEAGYSVAGSGEINAADFKVKNLSVSVSGSGDIECHATDFLRIRTSGSGSVGYKGSPELDVPKKGYYKL